MASVSFEGAPETQNISISNVNCTGDELRLSECASNNGSTCDHSQDVGVICSITQGNY